MVPGSKGSRAARAAGLLLLLVGFSAAVSGCHRKPLPSPEYLQAKGIYDSLIASKGDEGYQDVEMDRVYALCNAVTDKSSDYAAARALMTTIEQERSRLEAIAKGLKPATPPTAPEPSFLPRPKVDDAPPDAGQPPPEGLQDGADWTALQAKYGPCFVSKGNIAITGNLAGNSEGFTLADRFDCPKAFDAVKGLVVLVRGGKVLTRVPAAALKMETVYQLPDGGTISADSGYVPPAPPPPPDAQPDVDAGPGSLYR